MRGIIKLNDVKIIMKESCEVLVPEEANSRNKMSIFTIIFLSFLTKDFSRGEHLKFF